MTASARITIKRQLKSPTKPAKKAGVDKTEAEAKKAPVEKSHETEDEAKKAPDAPADEPENNLIQLSKDL